MESPCSCCGDPYCEWSDVEAKLAACAEALREARAENARLEEANVRLEETIEEMGYELLEAGL